MFYAKEFCYMKMCLKKVQIFVKYIFPKSTIKMESETVNPSLKPVKVNIDDKEKYVLRPPVAFDNVLEKVGEAVMRPSDQVT